MEKFGYKAFKSAVIVWFVWSTFLTGYELIRLQIPMKMHVYEEDAMEVLSGGDKKIDTSLLNMDFIGEIEIARVSDKKYEAVCQLFGVIPLKRVEVEVISKQEVIPGGIPVGIYVQTDGVFVIGTGMIETENGKVDSPAKNIM